MRIRRSLAAVSAGAALAVGIAAAPAQAATDILEVQTTDWCGTVRFIDYGEGAPGGGPNDDYTEISDNCSDGHGVRAWAWLDGTALGSKYHGGGVTETVVWDPFGNVAPGGFIGLKVCLVDGADDKTGDECYEASVFIDG